MPVLADYQELIYNSYGSAKTLNKSYSVKSKDIEAVNIIINLNLGDI